MQTILSAISTHGPELVLRQAIRRQDCLRHQRNPAATFSDRRLFPNRSERAN